MHSFQNDSFSYPIKEEAKLCSEHGIKNEKFLILGYLLLFGICTFLVPLLPPEVSNIHSLALAGSLIVFYTLKNRFNSFHYYIMFTFAAIPIFLAFRNTDQIRYAELMSVHFYLVVVNYCSSWLSFGIASATIATSWIMIYSYNPQLIITQRHLNPTSNARTPEEIKIFIFVLISSGIHCLMMKYKHNKAINETVQAKKRLEEAYTQLEETNRRLQESLEEKDNLILSFSHELKNPMNLLLISSKILSEGLTDGRLQQIARDCYITAEKMSHLLNNIFDTAKLDQGRLEICSNRVNIRNLLESFWKIAQEMITKKRLTGELKIARSVPKIVKIDATRLSQMLFNLVSNAVKYTEKGKITLNVEFERQHFPQRESAPNMSLEENINVANTEKHNTLSPYAISRVRTLTQIALNTGGSLNDDGSSLKYHVHHHSRNNFAEVPSNTDEYLGEGFLSFSLSDTGCGIDQSIQEQITNRSYLQKLRFDGRRIGAKLGLWITNQICRSMGGALEIFQEKPLGTTARIKLPTQAYGGVPNLPNPFQSFQVAKSKSFADVKSYNPRGEKSLRVMIVEDDSYNQYIQKIILEQAGLEVVFQAMNGREALEYYKKHSDKIDAITMDLDMPVMKGDDCCEAIRKFEAVHKKRPCPIVIVSAYSTDSEISRCTNPNGSIRANYFVRKPMSSMLIQGIFDEISKEK